MKQLRQTKRVPSQLGPHLQIFELKQMADMEENYKKQCRQSIIAYKTWLKRYEAETDLIELLYGNLEGTMLRRRAQDIVSLYWRIRRDFRCAFKEYLEKNCSYPSTHHKSKAA